MCTIGGIFNLNGAPIAGFAHLLLHSAGLNVGELLRKARFGYAVPAQFRPMVQPMNETVESPF